MTVWGCEVRGKVLQRTCVYPVDGREELSFAAFEGACASSATVRSATLTSRGSDLAPSH